MTEKWIEQDWEREALKDDIYSLERRIEEEQKYSENFRIKIIIHKSKTSKNDSRSIRENHKERL